MVCLNCNKETSENENFCQNCNEEFPWMKESRRLEGMIKVRETSRFRAASTFINDYLKSKKTGKPIPFDSIKGLLNAWLFKSGMILIAIGTLITSFTAIAQLVLLYRQENILENQSQLMNDQNQLEMYGYIKEIKSLLSKMPLNGKGEDVTSYHDNQDSISYWPIASDSEIESVVLLSKLDSKNEVQEILRSFLKKKNENVSLGVGALIALNRIDKEQNKNKLLDIKESQINFSKVKLTNRILKGIKLGKADFSEANFNRVVFDSIYFLDQTTFSNTHFNSSKITMCKFDQTTKFDNSLFTGHSSIHDNFFGSTKFRDCNFENIKFLDNNIQEEVTFFNCNFWDNQNSIKPKKQVELMKIVFVNSKANIRGQKKSTYFESINSVKKNYLTEESFKNSFKKIKQK